MEFSDHRQPPREWTPWLDEWVGAMRAQGNSPRTIENWWYVVGHLALKTRKSPEDITGKDIIDWLNRGVGANSKRSDVNACTAFFGWACRTGRRKDNPMDLVPTVHRDRRKQIPAPVEAVEKAKHCADKRALLTIMLMDEAGLRRSELAMMHTRDVIDDLTGKSIIVHGKGGKDRIIPLSDQLGRIVSSLPEGYFFPGEHDGHVCHDTIYRIVKNATGWPSHAFRRKFATDLWRATGGAMKVKEMLGHESLQTAQNYIYATLDDLRDAVDELRAYRGTDARKIHPEKILEAYNVPPAITRLLLDSIRNQE